MKDNILNIINNVSEKEFEEEFLKNGFEFEQENFSNPLRSRRGDF